MTIRQAPDQLYIGGNWVDATDKSFELINPATGKSLGFCPGASPADVQQAVAAARAAFDDEDGAWRQCTGAQRAEYLRKMAARIKERRDDLARLDVLNGGKPLTKEAYFDIDDVCVCLLYCAAEAEKLDSTNSETVDLNFSQPANTTSRIDYVAKGVVGAITPWNYPLLMAMWKIAPALAAGCTIVIKPSELSPWSAMELGKIATEIGLPAGVLNIVTGVGAVTGNALSHCPDIDHLQFTGSVATGKKVGVAAIQNIKSVGLELGGKSPIVVCEDADLDTAISAIKMGIFFNQGEVCSATSRLIVHEDIAETLLTRLRKEAMALRLGDGLDPETEMGPLVSATQQQRVLGYINGAITAGAKLLCGGKAPTHLPGYFVEPTIFTEVTPNMTIWKEEVFGPVLAVTRFSSREQAITLANDSVYGLAAAIISKDANTCEWYAKRFKAGIVWKNASQPTYVEAPWSGWKQSGIGVELGKSILAEYLRVKQVTEVTAG